MFNVDYVDVFKRLRQNDMYVVNAPQRQMQQFATYRRLLLSILRIYAY